VIAGKVGVNDTLAAWLFRHRCTGWLGLPRLGRVGAKEPADSLGIKLVLVPEMTIKPSVRQTGVLHHFVDRDLGKSLSVE
jgi:hypothetical protein